jgi:hypothetical protein
MLHMEDLSIKYFIDLLVRLVCLNRKDQLNSVTELNREKTISSPRAPPSHTHAERQRAHGSQHRLLQHLAPFTQRIQIYNDIIAYRST